MTMTESNPDTRNNGNATREVAALSDQLVLSGAGFTSHGITSARRVVRGAVETGSSE